jgi:hypothetical protein
MGLSQALDAADPQSHYVSAECPNPRHNDGCGQNSKLDNFCSDLDKKRRLEISRLPTASVYAYNDAMSTKFQITLPNDLALELKQAASREKLPLAQFIRETMEIRLRQQRSARRGDPFASITDLVATPDTHLSESVDEILYK